MTLPSRPCFAVARRVAVALAVLLSGVVSSPTQADVLGDLTGGGSGCGVTMTCTGGGSGSGSGSGGTTLPGGTGGYGTCTSNGAGSPCGLSSGPASQSASTTGQNVGAGNPLNVLSGNKYQMEVDLAPLPGVLGLEIVRHYNSQYARPNVPSGIFGRGWKLSYETELYVVKNTVQVVQADGTRIIFSRDAKDPSLCATRDPSRGTVRVQPSPDGESFVWVWPEGRRLFFDARGKLVQIVAPTGEFVALTRDAAGALLKVTDPQGRSLTLSYGSKTEKDAFRGVRFIDSPVGRFAYAYGSPLPEGAEALAKEAGSVARVVSNLVSVTLPATYAATEKAHPWANRGTTQSAVTRSYHYESPRHPTLLTGVSVSGTGSDGVPMQVRVASWDYDDAARAILSVKGARAAAKEVNAAGAEAKAATAATPVGPEAVRLAFPGPGTTVLTNSLGQTTTYRWREIAGELRLLESIGPGCASCGPTNVRYAYDAAGRLTVSTRLDAQGAPLVSVRQSRDAAGRVIREERFRFVKGKPVPAGWVRFEYAAVPAGPSAGASPSSAEPEASALPDPKPLRVIRPSVVAGKTHEWRYTYNTAGQILSVTESGFAPALPDEGTRGEPKPIERTTTYAYTTINGRSLLSAIDGPLPNGPRGNPSDSDVTSLTWDGRGDFVTSVTAPGNKSLRFQQNEDQRRLLSATLVWADTVQRIRYGYGSRGELASLTLDALSPDETTVLGTRSIAYQRDARNQPRTIGWFDGTQSSISDTFDVLNNPSRLNRGNVTSGIKNIDLVADEEGSTRFSVLSDNLRAVFGVPGSTAEHEVVRFETGTRSAKRLFDDFGRVVALQNPGQGWQVADYAADDRLIRVVNASGIRHEITYNPAGQLVRVQRHGANRAASTETVSIRWHGPYREEETVADAEGAIRHRMRYAYTLWGEQARQEAEILEAPTGRIVRLQQALHYDTVGRLVSRTLPSGERLAYRYFTAGTEAGKLAQVERVSWAPWLDFLMTRLPEQWQPKTVVFGPETVQESGEHDQAEASVRADHRNAPIPEPGLADLDTTLEADADGLPLRLHSKHGEMRLKWNAAHQLVAVDNPLNERVIARYTYDARGRRASKTTPEGKEFYLYEGTQLIAVLRESPAGANVSAQSQWREYLYHGYRPIAWLAEKTVYRLRSDHRGALTAVLPAAETGTAPLWESGTNAWGDISPTADDSRLDPGLRLVNQYADKETGLSYNVGRYYDPRIGRFISPDPSGIADSIDAGTPAALKLDSTAYAAGQPGLYFDPDGAARLVYYAITTGKKGQSLGKPQGFTKARWAFTIEDIQADGTGGSAAINQLMQTYASDGTGLLYDANGNFLSGSTKVDTWNGQANSRVTAFQTHYGANLISIAEFTIDNFSNRDAALLIASLTGNTESLGMCPNASGLLPEIDFGPEDAAINVTRANANGARLQRILNCTRNQNSTAPMAYANDTERNRVEKYVAAAELNEVSKIGRDCSQDGCPGVDIVGQTGTVYHASYGRTQFIGSTFLKTIAVDMSAADRATIGVTLDILQRIQEGRTRASAVAGTQQTPGLFSHYRNRYTCATAAGAWDNAGQAAQPPAAAPLTLVERNNFQTQTGLGRQAFIDMICFVPAPPARPLGEGRAAFSTEAIFTDTVLRDWMMELFRDTDRFDLLSRLLIRSNLNTILNTTAIAANFQNNEARTLANGSPNLAYATRQRQIEEELAMRVGRLHNGGTGAAISTDLDVLTRACTTANKPLCDMGNYVNKYVGNKIGFGEWRSLRCAENPTTGTGATSTVQALQMTTLQL